MAAIAAIAIFPVLTLLLFGLAKAERILAQAASLASQRRPAEPPPQDLELGESGTE